MTRRNRSIIIKGDLNIILSTTNRVIKQKEIIRDTEYFINTMDRDF